MDKLLTPDIGLTVWTVVTFLCVVFILGRFAWKPILSALEAREARIREDVRSAEESRRAAEASRREFESRLAGAKAETRALLDQAEKAKAVRQRRHGGTKKIEWREIPSIATKSNRVKRRSDPIV